MLLNDAQLFAVLGLLLLAADQMSTTLPQAAPPAVLGRQEPAVQGRLQQLLLLKAVEGREAAPAPLRAVEGRELKSQLLAPVAGRLKPNGSGEAGPSLAATARMCTMFSIAAAATAVRASDAVMEPGLPLLVPGRDPAAAAACCDKVGAMYLGTRASTTAAFVGKG